MIDKLVEYFIDQQLKAGMFTNESISVYRYGYTLLFEMVTNMVIAIIIGCFFHELPVVVFFLFNFIPLRSYCGGYHATKAWRCIILSNAFIAFVVLFSSNMYLSINNKVIFLLEIICIGLIMALAPIQSSAKKLNDNEKQIYKKYIKLILIIQIILEIFFLSLGLNKFIYVIISSHIIQALALVTARYKIRIINFL